MNSNSDRLISCVSGVLALTLFLVPNTFAQTLSPTISKSFGTLSLLPGGSTSLTFTLSNPNTTTTLTGLSFFDSLPAGLLVSTPNGLAGSCGGGTITALPGGDTIGLSGATLAAGASCTFAVNVTAALVQLGLLTNTTGGVSSNEAPTVHGATATIFVGDPFQVSYASNLTVGDSTVEITNSGAAGAGLQSGTSASITGSICANVYVFSPDEELVSCCSCPVTPNGLVSLSAQQDLISNPLTRGTSTSIIIKLLATAPVGGSCANSAAGVGTASLVNGLAAWSTTLHANSSVAPPTFGVTEKPFTSSDLSASELGRLASTCGFVLSQGSGFGICNSCRLGGL